MKGRICFVLLPVMAVFSVLLSAACTFGFNSNRQDNITVYLWDSRLLDNYAPYIQSHFPDDDIQFAVVIMILTSISSSRITADFRI